MKRNGFTLIELLIVVAIMVILCAAVVFAFPAVLELINSYFPNLNLGR